ncbi:ABC transporter ATP-binding protein [Sorangium sp. So ce295]|jgi:ABC-2 type transport system ATP-binding protein|uniref:ABC transporter ATP-binding protein n=1 Tax=Sorangium sp. So ce295 TaxID=3133295 RepID=UPI003F5EE5C8
MSPGAPVVVLEGVRARDGAGEEGRPRGGLSGLSLALGSGVHAVLGAPEDGTLALAEVLAGRAAPLAGRVLVAGRDPCRSAATRAQIGVLAATPELPDGASVASFMSVALRARGAPASGAAALLEPLGVAPLLARSTASLSFSEARAVELSLALGVPRPLLLCLVEPFADVAVPSPEPVRERLRALAAAGACVVLVTSSTADASALADRIHVLDRGVIARTEPGAGDRLAAAPPGATPPGAGRPEVEIHVLVHERAPDAPGARALAAALASAPAVRAGAWEQGPAEASSTLRIRAADREAAALAILDAAAREDVTLIAISSPPPSMHDVRAATALHLAAVRSRRPFGAPAVEGAAPLPGAPEGPFAVAAFDAPAPLVQAAPLSRPSDGPSPPAGVPLSAHGDAAAGGRIGADPAGADGSPHAAETGRHDGG